MSPARSDIDLERFARDAPGVPEPRRRWRRFALPLVVLVGFTVVLLWSLRDVLLPRAEVTVLRPRLVEGGTLPGAVALQAAGWVEPDPFSRHVVPLTPGTVAEILVQESDRVKRDDVVARLVPDDAKLELDRAQALLGRAVAESDRSQTALDFAKEDFAAAIALTERVAVARAEVSGRKAESERLAEAARRTRADLRVAIEELEVQRHLAESGAAGPRQVELAEARTESARAASASADAAAARAVADLGVAEAKLASALTEQKLRIADRRAVALAETGLAVAEARVVEAQAAEALAKLRFSRVEVTSPWDGTVLERLTLPGATVGGQDLDHAAICSLYDPGNLRVRVDVPQQEVAKVSIGQTARIRCESRRERPYDGRVVRVVRQADIQKVTLQVHVEVIEPDELLRPEMLCQVQFIAGADPSRRADGARSLLIPQRLLVGRDQVWVLDVMTGSARLRKITPGSLSGDWIEVRSGLNFSDKLIDAGRTGLEDGTRVRVKGGP